MTEGGKVLELELGEGLASLKVQVAIKKSPRDRLLDTAHYGPLGKLSCAWAMAAKKRARKAT